MIEQLEPIDTCGLPLEEARAIWISQLQAKCPLTGPVDIVWSYGRPRLEDGEQVGGTSLMNDDASFTIEVYARYARETQREILCHEWAHCMSWGLDTHDHGSAWGVAYQQCYQACIQL